MDFLRQLAYKNVVITEQFNNMDEPNSACSDDESDPESESGESSGASTQSSSQPSASQNMCQICSIRPFSMVLIPCGHLCCEQCWDEHAHKAELTVKPRPKNKRKDTKIMCPKTDCVVEITKTQKISMN